MKVKYTLLALAVLVCFPLFAQKNNKCSVEEFRAKQQAYMTQKAGLTTEEARNFFPLYFELQDKKRAMNKHAWAEARQGVQPQTTEDEYGTIIDHFFSTQHEILDLEKEYIEKYRKILTNRKIYMIYWAEIKFNRNMMKILQKVDDNKK